MFCALYNQSEGSSMPFVLEALPAHKGDCLLLHYGSDAEPKLAVIDGGPSSTYKPHLRPRLRELRQRQGLGQSQPLIINWLMVSHIDDDHIKGVLELTADMVSAKQGNAPPPYKIGTVWHNSFDDILKTKPEELKASISAQYGAASTADAALARSPNISRDAAMILVSVAQGRQLRDDVKVLNLHLNSPFDGLIMLDDADPAESRFTMSQQLSVQVIGPMKPQLQKLQKEHDQWLRANNKQRTDPEAALAAFSDKSVPNLSSIVVLVEQGGKTMLLTGDARGDFILEGLETAQLLDTHRPCVVDVLKAPHHGSDNNVEQSFFERVHATHYVFSGDGKHGNPERETFEMLFEARRNVAALHAERFHIYLTYSLEDTDVFRREEWDKQFKRGNRSRQWDHKLDSLEAFFEDEAPGFGLSFKLHAGEPVSITP
jgi:beta-lactamase superfamily II metal-dependent hydrolase